MISASETYKRISTMEQRLLARVERQITIKDKRMIIHAAQDKCYIPNATGLIAHNDHNFVRVIMGPYGSGKTTWSLTEIVFRACAMPVWHSGRRRSRWGIVRNTSGELFSTTLASWIAWFDGLGDIRKRQKPILTYEHSFNDGHGIVELELLFIALDRPEDVRKIKSLELTGCYINELSEVPQAAMQHMKGRVNRYPSKAFCKEPYWAGIIADTNPPEDDHWIFKDFEQNTYDNHKLFKQPPGLIKNEYDKWVRNPSADNVNNLPNNYYEMLAEGQSSEFIKVFCLGEYGSVGFGKRVYPEFNPDFHAMDVLSAIQGEPLLLGWDFGLCYSDDTDVLTDSGWKLFKDVDELNDLVATRNPLTKALEFTKINFKVEYDYDSDLLEWASSEVNFLVTPEHRVPFTYRDTPDKVHFQSAQWLSEHHGGHHYVDLCSDWKPDFDENVKYFGMDPLTFSEFMGLYLSEGHVFKAGNSFKITIYQNKQCPVMQEILNRTGLNWTYRQCGWHVTNNELGLYLKSFGLAQEKFVPQEIKDFSSLLIKSFIYAYTKGDGHIRTRKNGSIEHTIFTASQKMADDFQELAQKAGWNSSIHVVDPQSSVIIEEGIERVITNKGGFSICFKKRAKRAELLKRNFQRVPYKGKIYCLNVPYHTLYIRRNGQPSWNGNTPACVVLQLSARGQLLILKEYVADGMGIRTFADSVVIPHIAKDFPYCKVGMSIGDPAGNARSEIVEEMSCIGELNSLGIPTHSARTNDIDPRIGSVRYFLNKMVDGKPGLLLDRRKCPILFKGFVKDYVYARIAVSGEERYKDKPLKNMASHPMDGLGYACLEIASDRITADKMGNKEKVEMYNPVMRIF